MKGHAGDCVHCARHIIAFVSMIVGHSFWLARQNRGKVAARFYSEVSARTLGFLNVFSLEGFNAKTL